MPDFHQGASLIEVRGVAVNVVCRLLLLSAFLAVTLWESSPGYSQVTECPE